MPAQINYKKFGVIFLIIAAIIGLAYFMIRPFLMGFLIEKKLAALQSNLHCKITYQQVSFENIQGIQFLGLQAEAQNKSWHFSVDSLAIRWTLFSALQSVPDIMDLRIGHLNYREFQSRTTSKPLILDTTQKRSSWKDRILKVPGFLSKIFTLFPANVHFRSGNIFLADTAHQFQVVIQDFYPNSKGLAGNISLKQDTLDAYKLQCQLAVDKHIRKITGFLKANSEAFIPVGYFSTSLPQFYFDSLTFETESSKYSGDEFFLKLRISSHQAKLWHDKLNKEPVSIENFQGYFPIYFDKQAVKIDSSCFIQVNDIRFRSFVQAEFQQASRMQFWVKTDMMPAKQFFTSLPTGMFQSFEGIHVSGDLGFYLNFSIDFHQLDSLFFDAGLVSNTFEYLAPGKIDFSKVNTDFIYYPIHGNRVIHLGRKNTGYVPLANISPLLREAVQQAEDGQFYWHHGFNMAAIRKAIATNIREKRFARGASTLTMQFVKNVFLKHEKRLSRKLEEMLIVWLIENKRLVSKDRILELYLNLIEWGPDIYGAKEAAAFYFAKSPADITLSEALFLAMIIPRPLGFKYHFNPETGQLETFNTLFYKVVANHLLINKVITQPDYDSLKVIVTLNGPAKTYLRYREVSHSDSLKDETIIPDSLSRDFWEF